MCYIKIIYMDCIFDLHSLLCNNLILYLLLVQIIILYLLLVQKLHDCITFNINFIHKGCQAVFCNKLIQWIKKCQFKQVVLLSSISAVERVDAQIEG